MTPVLEVKVEDGPGRLRARHRLRLICRRLKIESRRRARLGIAVGEVLQTLDGARLAMRCGIVAESKRPALRVELTAAHPAQASGPVSAIPPPRLDLARLVDRSSVRQANSGQVVVELELDLDTASLSPEDPADLAPMLVAGLTHDLAAHPYDAASEGAEQHEEFVQVMQELYRREADIQRMGAELEESNRGVLALYSELDDAARQWHTTFDSISDGVCLLDGQGRIVRVNDPMLQLLGCTFDEIVGRLAPEVVANGLGVLDLPGMIPSLAQTHRRQSTEVQAGDRWFTFVLDTIPSRGESQVAGAVLTVSDITERKRLDDAQRLTARRESEAVELRGHAERMAALERMKSDFLNLASHELRGPLAVLRGYISMLDDGSLGELTPPMKLVVPIMTGKMREMNLLINQMLETARIEDSRLVLNRERLDLREVLSHAEESVRPLASNRHELVVLPGEMAVVVHGDRHRLTTILTNLIDNAIKYSPKGGEVRCELIVAEARAHVRVSDSGLGIHEDDLPKLFTRFGRLLNAENSHIPGTGLGLYLSRELARMHGGDIHVESQLGSGSTFSLSLPRMDGNEEGSKPDESQIQAAS